MISRKIVIAAGAATVAGALSATIAFAAEAHATAGGSGTSTTLPGGGSAFAGGAVAERGGGDGFEPGVTFATTTECAARAGAVRAATA